MSELEPTAADPSAGEIDALVDAVPGVTRVFSVDPAALRAARRLLRRDDPAPLPLSSVTRADGVLRIVVSVGVSTKHPVAGTAELVAATIRARAGADARVTVRVSRVVAARG